MKQTITVEIDTDGKRCGCCPFKLIGICYLKQCNGLITVLKPDYKKDKFYRTSQCLKEAKPCKN